MSTLSVPVIEYQPLCMFAVITLFVNVECNHPFTQTMARLGCPEVLTFIFAVVLLSPFLISPSQCALMHHGIYMDEQKFLNFVQYFILATQAEINEIEIIVYVYLLLTP